MINLSALHVLAVFEIDPADETKLVLVGYEVWNGSHFIASCWGIEDANGILLAILDQAIAVLLENARYGSVLTIDHQHPQIHLYSDVFGPEACFNSPYKLKLWAVEVAVRKHDNQPDMGYVLGYQPYRLTEAEPELIGARAHVDLQNSFETFLLEFKTTEEPFLTPNDPSEMIVRAQTLVPGLG